MTLVRVNPQRRINNFENYFNHMFNHLSSMVEDDSEVVERVWRPRADILEGENEYRVVMDLPGVKSDEVDITIEDGVLSISGERKNEVGEDERCCYVNERAHGKFNRKFKLHNVIDSEKISAKFENGILTILLPKLEAAKPRKIEISAN